MQIVNTLKCNFKCSHCCFSCHSRRKDKVSFSDFETFMDKFVAPYSNFVNFCGGEIFLHPEWRKQLQYIGYKNVNLRIVTNGSLFFTKNKNLTKVGKDFFDILQNCFSYKVSVSICVSDDTYHQNFLREKCLLTSKEVSNMLQWELENLCLCNVTIEEDGRMNSANKVMPLGRAKKTGVYDHKGRCNFEPDLFDITLGPDGYIYACYNLKGMIGTPFNSVELIEENLSKIKTQKNCFECKLSNYGRKKTEIF